MALPLPLLRDLQTQPAAGAWASILGHTWELFAAPVTPEGAVNEVTKRDRLSADLDLFLAAAGWDLWGSFETSVEPAADALVNWWAGEPASGKAVLILDGLSLRELPWLLQEATARGYKIHQARPAGAELPAETTAFAAALGFGQRSSLENNGAGSSHRLAPARTETLDLPWEDCRNLIGAEPRWVLWHHWPDNRAHALNAAGKGLGDLVTETARELGGEGFWSLVHRLTTGRRLVITSDHGYAATGLFSDAPDEQAKHLKERFKSGRFAKAEGEDGPWVPPVSLRLTSRRGTYAYAIGRRKWKSQGGYPTLAHGGLSLLEVVVPFLELSRMA